MTRLITLAAVVLVLFAAFAVAASAQDLDAIEQQLKPKLRGRTFLIRNFYTNSKLIYDLNGNLQNKPELLGWRLAEIQVDDVKLRADRLELDGKRVITTNSRPKTKPESFLTDEKIEIQVSLAGASPDEAAITTALNRVFLTNADDVARLEQEADQQGPGTWRVGVGVSAPRATYTPDPEYTVEARHQKLQGTVLLWVLVGEDGRVRDVHVVRHLGLGLDDSAVHAVKNWRFTPAVKNGKPVPVQMNVEVNFRLYN